MASSTAQYMHDNAGDFGPAFKFAEIGDHIEGTVLRANIVEGLDLQNRPQTSLVIGIQRPSDNTEHSVWIKPGQQLSALVAALKAAKPGVQQPDLVQGDKMAMVFDHTEPSKSGLSPKKVYTCVVRAGNPRPVVSSMLGEDPFPVEQRTVPTPPVVDIDELI